MAKKLRLRFKKDAIGAAPRGSSIIIENKDIGFICQRYETPEWVIRIKYPRKEKYITKEDPREWLWMKLKYRGSSLEDTQEFVRKNVDRIYEQCYKED